MPAANFTPQPGQIDFTHARWVPVVNCVVQYQDTILVVKRSETVNFYPGYWNGISGFLDDQQSLEEKVYAELAEETGIARTQVSDIQLGEIFDQEEPQYTKTWVIHPVLVRVTTDTVSLDWEAHTHRWVSVSEVRQLDLLPGFAQVIDRVAHLMHA